jgi:hypothetical protein
MNICDTQFSNFGHRILFWGQNLIVIKINYTKIEINFIYIKKKKKKKILENNLV